MINSLVVAILVIALFQKTAERRFPALVFAFFTWLHCVALSGGEGLLYFFTAGLCDVAIISIIASWAKITRLSDALITISLVSIISNFYGWISWVNYLPVKSYNIFIMALYLIAILSLLWKDCAHDYTRINQRHRWLRLLADKCGAFCFSLLQKART